MRPILTIIAGMALAAAGFAEAQAAPLGAATGLAKAASADTSVVKVQNRGGGARFRGGGGNFRRWPRMSSGGFSGRSFARGGVRRGIPGAGARGYVRRRPPSGARVAGLNSRRQFASRRPPQSFNTVRRRPPVAGSTASLRRPRPGLNPRPGAAQRRWRGRPVVGRTGRPGNYAGGPRHYRRGWHRGEPRWRGARRFHRGRYWRQAYDGWYYWWNNAWFWAPTFGVIITAGYPYYGYGSDYDDYGYGYLEPWSDEWFLYCSRRYRSFDPATGYFVTYGGERRFCVYVG